MERSLAGSDKAKKTEKRKKAQETD